MTLYLPGQPPFLKVRSSSVFEAFGLGSTFDADTPDTLDPIGFGGQHGYYRDYTTGLYLLTHRYYDAGAGRFVTRDPIGYTGGINLYGFAGNNPVNESDPSGFDPNDTNGGVGHLLPNANSEYSDGYQQFTQGQVPEYGDNYHGMARVGGGGPSFVDAIGNFFRRIIRSVSSTPSPRMRPALAVGGGQGVLPLGNLPAPTGIVHGNSASSQKPSHTYEILDGSGDVYKYGESGDGINGSGKSIRAEKQVRKFMRETGENYSSNIIRHFTNKADALQHQADLIRSYERRFGIKPVGNRSGYR